MDLGGGTLGLIALITWVVAAVGGLVMLGVWVRRGGVRRSAGATTRLPPGLVFGHFLVAVAGLIIWIIYLVADADVLAWVSFVILLLVAGLGLTMFVRWVRQQPGSADSARPDTAERHFPLAVVLAHGLFAIASIVLVLLVALEVGGS